MYFDEIIHGTQYYRTPTPLPEEWEGDVANFEAFNLDAFQIRMNWRWNERVEGVYDFSDVDKLLELAEKYNRKVIMKFLLECAPQYVFDKYGGTRIGPMGEKLRGGAHGAFYGGWRPCFTNPLVMEKALKFVEVCVKRYAGNKNIILWNTWNEIRNKPIEDCFCDHCRAGFGKYLKGKFGTIENLNAHYGAAEESFEAINLPIMAHGYWDMYEFKKYKGSAELKNWIESVHDAIRKYDKITPIMCHAGICNAFQHHLGDVCDDYEISKAVDFWGTSLPFGTNMDTHLNRINMFTLCDFMRSVDENYFIHEIYPGLGMFRWYDTPFDMKFKLYAGLSGGAKGLIYWQYRAERVGNEADCAGIMRMDGSPKDVAFEIRDFGDDLHKDMKYFSKASTKKAKVAIVFDFNSELMGRIEETCRQDYNVHMQTDRQYYNNAHRGLYKMVRDAGYDVEYVGATHPEQFENYSVLLFPYHIMLDEAIIPHLEKFVNNGGIIYADEGFGMRQSNTWMNPYDIAAKPLMSARMMFRHETKKNDFIEICGKKVAFAPYRTEYKAENADVLASFDNGVGASFSWNVGKGKVYLNGFSSGYSYFQTGDDAWLSLIEKIMNEAGIEKYKLGDCKNCIYERRMDYDGGEIVFIFNCSEKSVTFDLEAKIVSHGADAIIDGSKMTVNAGEIGYAVIEL